jgi:UPF0755 protein
MWRHIAANFLTFFIVALFLLAGGFGLANKTYRDAGPLTQAICLEVPRGTNMAAVAANLADQGAIAYPRLFRIGADYTDKAGQLKAGSFLVPQGASMAEITDIITRGGANSCGTEVVYRIGVTQLQVQVRELDPAIGRFAEVASFNPAVDQPPANYANVRAQADTRYRIALAEGVTSWQVLTSLQGMDVLVNDVTDIPAEGSLAPDSYDIILGAAVSDILAQMTARQDAIIANAWANRAADLPLASAEEMLILASIIEKETSEIDERRLVSSVFINRLNQGMRLQTDPTVIYGVTQGQGTLGRGLRQSELRGATPWNTYVIDGLPPTPIANPGRASIEAAVNPDTSDYIFFVADGTGGHAFATNLTDHNRNVAAWRRIEAERANP